MLFTHVDLELLEGCIGFSFDATDSTLCSQNPPVFPLDASGSKEDATLAIIGKLVRDDPIKRMLLVCENSLHFFERKRKW